MESGQRPLDVQDQQMGAVVLRQLAGKAKGGLGRLRKVGRMQDDLERQHDFPSPHGQRLEPRTQGAETSSLPRRSLRLRDARENEKELLFAGYGDEEQ